MKKQKQKEYTPSDDIIIDSILSGSGEHLTTIEVEAFMRDEWYNKRNDLSLIYPRFLPNGLREDVKKHEKEFYELIEKFWVKAKKRYRPTLDKKAGKLRKKALKILEDHLAWEREVNFVELFLDELCPPREEMLIYELMQNDLRDILYVLNTTTDKDAQEFKGFTKKLREMAATLLILEEKVAFFAGIETVKKEDIKPKRPPKKQKATEDSIYQLKILLLGVEPTIWRRVQVRANTSFCDFHNVVQCAMGWENCHLYQFGVGPFGRCEVEKDVTLYPLIKEPGDALYYLYDFGDSWEHEIILEKIINQPRRKHYPVCTAGRYACPPEDCGGVPGFQRLLYVMKKKKYPEYRELREWLGGRFDINDFDLDEVNQMMRDDR